jgi:hypothetical protein
MMDGIERFNSDMRVLSSSLRIPFKLNSSERFRL